jgi:hypothetical protein
MALDIVEEIDDLRKYRKSFILSPKQWQILNIPRLKWKSVKFLKQNRDRVPPVRGIYVFMIKHRTKLLPSHGYIAYVGLTGDRNERTLNARYGDYLRDQSRPKRVHVYELLNRWKNDVYFYFAEVPDRKVSLSALENNLLDSLIPPYNRKDFTGEFGRIVEEAFRQ